jgi:ATP-binding cassette subfamily B protein
LDEPVLEEVNLALKAGTTVAIVGENGAGKTTLVKLLCGFYQPTLGSIRVDGTSLADIDPEAWRSRVTSGFQDFVRFELLTKETVGVGDLARFDREDVVLAALERAGAQDIVSALPAGLETQLGRSWTGGAEISGGQWQKLALSRAMARESPLLLILDEPTASLDAETEHQLFERYSRRAGELRAAAGTITVLVSHRFSTVGMADLILVIDRGRIVEIGSHADLMDRGGMYAELFALQAAGYR